MNIRLKLLASAILVFCGFGVASEIIARTFFGLGDPPLTLRVPKIEYMFKPGEYHRFGNTISYNEFSMRSSPPPSKTAGKLHVLVLGDSIVNGGSLTDQKELATERLVKQLPAGSWVGNISAGGWGPANLTAYLRRFGTFDADVIFVVLSSHDLNDVPTFDHKLGPDFPETRPAFALEEAYTRYLPRYLPILSASPNTMRHLIARRGISCGPDNLVDLVDFLVSTPAQVNFILHPERAELSLGTNHEGQALRNLLNGLGVRYTEMAPHLDASKYRDSIHVNASGQDAYADIYFRMISNPRPKLVARRPCQTNSEDAEHPSTNQINCGRAIPLKCNRESLLSTPLSH
jgi:hypothetical protein